MIVFATRQAVESRVSTGLLRVSADGGEPTSLTTPDDARREDHLFPSMLPGGRAVLFTVMSDYDVNAAEVALLDLTTGQRKTRIRGASDAQYVEGGYVVSASAGALYAVRFDQSRLEIELARRTHAHPAHELTGIEHRHPSRLKHPERS